jgi:hypothetical protein
MKPIKTDERTSVFIRSIRGYKIDYGAAYLV